MPEHENVKKNFFIKAFFKTTKSTYAYTTFLHNCSKVSTILMLAT